MKASDLVRHLEKAINEHGDLPVAIVTLLGTTRVDRTVKTVELSEHFLAGSGWKYPEQLKHLTLTR